MKHLELSRLSDKERQLLKLAFVDCIPTVTLLWIYQVRYATMRKMLKQVLEKIK